MRTGGLSVAVCGPGHVRRFLSFVSDADLETFLRDTESSLAAAGFRFRGYAQERRQRAEHRSAARGPERRYPTP